MVLGKLKCPSEAKAGFTLLHLRHSLKLYPFKAVSAPGVHYRLAPFLTGLTGRASKKDYEDIASTPAEKMQSARLEPLGGSRASGPALSVLK